MQVGGPVFLKEVGRTRRPPETMSHQGPGVLTAERRGVRGPTWSPSSAASWPGDRGTLKIPKPGSTRRSNHRDHSWG